MPLAGVKVTCNVTSYFEQFDIPTQFFGNLATKSLSLEKAKALVQSVEIDNRRTVEFTDDFGLAFFKFRILKGLD